MRRLSRSEQDTIDIAAALAETITAPLCIFLSGPLGAGKSVFGRALIRSFLNAPHMEVPSPTFSLVQYYDGPAPLYHYDLYRLQAPEEIYELGWEESLAHGINIIEWPQRLSYLKPSGGIDIIIQNNADEPHARDLIIHDHRTNTQDA